MVHHVSGTGASSSTVGSEREGFVRFFLSEMLPPTFRFGSGDVTDQTGKHLEPDPCDEHSGQCDIVIEYPLLPSFRSLGGQRLYIAESVAAVIEVKSNVRDQWDQVEAKAEKIRALQRKADHYEFGLVPPEIPFFVVGYEGWKDIKHLVKRLAESQVDGILVIKSGLFATTERRMQLKRALPEFGGTHSAIRQPFIASFQVKRARRAWSLWGLLACLHWIIHGFTDDCADLHAYAPPEDYELRPEPFIRRPDPAISALGQAAPGDVSGGS